MITDSASLPMTYPLNVAPGLLIVVGPDRLSARARAGELDPSEGHGVDYTDRNDPRPTTNRREVAVAHRRASRSSRVAAHHAFPIPAAPRAVGHYRLRPWGAWTYTHTTRHMSVWASRV